jgi:glutathione S-transferase
MRLIQLRFSHNCIKVRRALELKGIAFDQRDISPLNRHEAIAASGQERVPVLVDGEQAISDSTAILRHLEQSYPERALLPDDPARQAACWLIEDWADQALMKLTRRMAYWYRMHVTPDVLCERFFPEARGLKRWLMFRRARQVITRRFNLSVEQNRRDEAEAPRVARIALDRLGGRAGFFDGQITVADVTVAAMAAPLFVTEGRVRRDPSVSELLDWARPILGDDTLRLYGESP